MSGFSNRTLRELKKKKDRKKESTSEERETRSGNTRAILSVTDVSFVFGGVHARTKWTTLPSLTSRGVRLSEIFYFHFFLIASLNTTKSRTNTNTPHPSNIQYSKTWLRDRFGVRFGRDCASVDSSARRTKRCSFENTHARREDGYYREMPVLYYTELDHNLGIQCTRVNTRVLCTRHLH